MNKNIKFMQRSLGNGDITNLIKEAQDAGKKVSNFDLSSIVTSDQRTDLINQLSGLIDAKGNDFIILDGFDRMPIPRMEEMIIDLMLISDSISENTYIRIVYTNPEKLQQVRFQKS